MVIKRYSKISSGNRVEVTQDIIDALNAYQSEHSQKQLAAELNVTSATIRRWISDIGSGINAECWNKIYDLLGDKINLIANDRDIITKHEEHKDYFSCIYQLLNKEYDPYDAAALLNNRKLMYEKAVQELQGISFAVSYDNELTDREIELLAKWLEKNSHFKDKWPILEVYDLFLKAVKSQKIDSEWKNEVLKFMKNISTCQDVTGLEFDCIDKLDFNGKNVVITGTFENGMSRDSVECLVIKLGGYFNSRGDIGAHTEILIVGEKGSKAWRFSGYGRKIETALEMRKNTGKPFIISETEFLKMLENCHDINTEDDKIQNDCPPIEELLQNILSNPMEYFGTEIPPTPPSDDMSDEDLFAFYCDHMKF